MNLNNSTGPTPVPPEAVTGNSLSHKVISSIAILILIILTLFGNALVIIAFYVFKRIRRSVTNWFIVSLAVSDIMVAFITEPIWLAGEITYWMYPPEINVLLFAQVWTMIDIVCAISSISNLMFISIDRYFAIKSPLIHHTKMTTGKCKWIIVALWIHGFGTSCLFLLTWHWKYLVIFMFGFLIPLCIMIFCYAGILSVVYSRSRLSTNRHGGRIDREYKTAKSLGVVTGAFVLCWLPFFITSLAYQYCESCMMDIDSIPAITSAVKWLHYLNSCLNPIIYAFLNPTFKLAFRNLIRRMLGKDIRFHSDPETSVSTFSFRRREANNTSIRRQNSGQPNTEKVPNGNLTCLIDPLLQHGDKNLANGSGPRDSISEDGSVERGIETPEETHSNCGQFCPDMGEHSQPLLSSHKNSCSLDKNSDDSESYLHGEESNVPESPKENRLGLLEPCAKARDRCVSFSEEVEICGEKPSGKDTDRTDHVSLDLPATERHFSTYHDEVDNRTYLVVDGVLIPEGEIKSSDV